jgi:hypothetical protein
MSARFVRVLPAGPGAAPGSRLRLERPEGEGLIDLVDEIVWPEQVSNPNSNHIRETRDALILTTDDARWLREALGELLAETDPEEHEE